MAAPGERMIRLPIGMTDLIILFGPPGPFTRAVRRAARRG